MPFAQDIIHRFEQGAGLRYLRIGLVVLGVIVFTGLYNWRAFKNMSTQEAMDQAQLARNLSEGKGYKTLFIRPVSMYLVKGVNEKAGRGMQPGAPPDYARIRTMHPDISNPPVYPVVLAGLLRILPLPESATETQGDTVWGRLLKKLPLKYTVSTAPPFRYPPEMAISIFNELLFFGLILALFFLAKQLFDATVAWLSAIVLFGTELFWRFATSGLSTMLVMVIFAGLLWGLFLLEREAREPKRSQAFQFGLAAFCGVMVGVGCLTRYAFGWFIIPLVLYLAIFCGPRRLPLAFLAFVCFAAVIAPWVVRNLWVSGLPFGTASFALIDNTFLWPANKLSRSLSPSFEVPVGISPMSPFWNKFFGTLKLTMANEIPRFSGSWVSAFFLAGLVVSFRNPSIQRLRYFVLFCLPVAIVVQGMGRTQLSEDSPELNTENLLVIFAPILLVYGVGFFMVLLDQIELPLAFLRYVLMGAFALLVSVPLLLIFLPPTPVRVAYPPYLSPRIQQVAGWMKEDELMMSDIPWAVAWYGNRQCVWLTRHMGATPTEPGSLDTFFAINDEQKPINAIYLTEQTMDGRFVSDWVKGGERSWANLIIDVLVNKIVPAWCPLRAAPQGLLPEQMLLADWPRWNIGSQPTVATPADAAPKP